MQSTYRMPRRRTGLVAVLAAVVPLAAPSTGIAADTTPLNNTIEPLARGAGYTDKQENQRVQALQRTLRRLGKRPGPIDGLFGPLTEAAVVRFQRGVRLEADGIVGRRTTRALTLAGQQQVARQAEAKRRYRRAVARRTVKRRIEAAMATCSRSGSGPRPSGGAAQRGPRRPEGTGGRCAHRRCADGLRAGGGGRTDGPLERQLERRPRRPRQAPRPQQRRGPLKVAEPVEEPQSRRGATAGEGHRLRQRSRGRAARPRAPEPARPPQSTGSASSGDGRWSRWCGMSREPRAPSRHRPGLDYALELMAGGDATCLAVSQLRRLSRSAAVWARFSGRSRPARPGWSLWTWTSTPPHRRAARPPTC